VRLGTPVFAGSPSPTASHDGITYTFEGSHDLVDYTAVVEPVLVPVTAGLPPPGDGYEFRSFRLAGSTALMEQGFLRAKVTQP
jgi:hypothetical protein